MDWAFLDSIPGAIRKPEPRKRTKGREKRVKAKDEAAVRAYVFERERGICRVCRSRRAQSRHELIPRGAGGKVTVKNAVAVCGQLVGTDDSCHTWLQLEQITVEMGPEGAEGVLSFTPQTEKAAGCMKVKKGFRLESPPTPKIQNEEHEEF